MKLCSYNEGMNNFVLKDIVLVLIGYGFFLNVVVVIIVDKIEIILDLKIINCRILD